MFKRFFFILLVLTNIFQLLKGQENTLLQKLMDDGKQIKGMLKWNIKSEHNSLLCVYSSNTRETITQSTLTFYKKNTNGFAEIFHYDIEGNIIGIYQTSERNGNLIVVWIPGNSYIVTVFSYLDGHVSLSMENSCQTMPEFVFLGSNTDEPFSILFTQKDWIMDKETGELKLAPKTSEVYKWARDHYDTLSVPWTERLDSRNRK